jgi:predicted  nucleic acid-binding Zn-ribbon protein
MKPTSKKPELDAELYEAKFMSAELDNLISSAEGRIERQRQYVRSVASDFEASMKAIADLDTMISALEALKRQRAQIVRWEQEKHWQAAALKFGWD